MGKARFEKDTGKMICEMWIFHEATIGITVGCPKWNSDGFRLISLPSGMLQMIFNKSVGGLTNLR